MRRRRVRGRHRAPERSSRLSTVIAVTVANAGLPVTPALAENHPWALIVLLLALIPCRRPPSASVAARIAMTVGMATSVLASAAFGSSGYADGRVLTFLVAGITAIGATVALRRLVESLLAADARSPRRTAWAIALLPLSAPAVIALLELAGL